MVSGAAKELIDTLGVFSQARCGQGFASQGEQFHGNGEAHQLCEYIRASLVVGYHQCTFFHWMVGSSRGKSKNEKTMNELMNENDALFRR